MLDEDLDLKARIADVFECAVKEVIALVETDRVVEKNSAETLPEWMTAAQLARYWQLVNANGEAVTAGIMKWTKRAENEHPLPHACMGDLLRFKREEVDRWARGRAETLRSTRWQTCSHRPDRRRSFADGNATGRNPGLENGTDGA